MVKQLLTMLTVSLAFSASGCDSSRPVENNQLNTASQTEATPETTTNAGETASAISETSSADTAFVARVSRSNMAEVKLGILAERKAMDLDVKNFGRQMQQDHRNTNSVLMNIARPKKWLTPEEMNAAQQAEYDRLDAMERTGFDKAYMDLMVKNHEEMVAMFEQASGTVSDPQLTEYIANTLPALRKHVADARNLRAKLK